METSKRILWCFSIFYIIYVAIFAVVKIFLDIDISAIFTNINTLMITIAGGYIGKSGVENVFKGKANNTNVTTTDFNEITKNL